MAEVGLEQRETDPPQHHTDVLWERERKEVRGGTEGRREGRGEGRERETRI